MKDNIAKFTKQILFVLMAISAIAGLLFYVNLLSEDLFIKLGYLLTILAGIVFVASPIYGYITNPQNIKLILISLGIGAVVLIISYLISKSEFTPLQLETYDVTAHTERLVGMGMIATYFLFGLSIVTFLYSAIHKALN